MSAPCFPGNSLARFFELVYRPIKLGRKDEVPRYRAAIRWLRDTLGREPTLEDLIAEASARQLQQLEALRQYANQLGLGVADQARRRDAGVLDPAFGDCPHCGAPIDFPSDFLPFCDGRCANAAAHEQGLDWLAIRLRQFVWRESWSEDERQKRGRVEWRRVGAGVPRVEVGQMPL